jgi:hypothetical protein
LRPGAGIERVSTAITGETPQAITRSRSLRLAAGDAHHRRLLVDGRGGTPFPAFSEICTTGVLVVRLWRNSAEKRERATGARPLVF